VRLLVAHPEVDLQRQVGDFDRGRHVQVRRHRVFGDILVLAKILVHDVLARAWRGTGQVAARADVLPRAVQTLQIVEYRPAVGRDDGRRQAPAVTPTVDEIRAGAEGVGYQIRRNRENAAAADRRRSVPRIRLPGVGQVGEIAQLFVVVRELHPVLELDRIVRPAPFQLELVDGVLVLVVALHQHVRTDECRIDEICRISTRTIAHRIGQIVTAGDHDTERGPVGSIAIADVRVHPVLTVWIEFGDGGIGIEEI